MIFFLTGTTDPLEWEYRRSAGGYEAEEAYQMAHGDFTSGPKSHQEANNERPS